MNITSEKEQIPMGSHYILKQSTLEKVMGEHDVDLAVHINFLRNKDILLDAHFYLPNERVDFARVYLRVGMVETKYYISRRNIWEKDIPQALVKWMQKQSVRFQQGMEINRPRFICRWEYDGLTIEEKE